MNPLHESTRTLATAVATVILCVVLGAQVVASQAWMSEISINSWAGAAVVVTFIAGGAALAALMRNLANRDCLIGMGTVAIAAGVAIGIILPGIQLITGVRTSILGELGATVPVDDIAVKLAFVLPILGLFAFGVGEALSSRRIKGSVETKAHPYTSRTDGPTIFYLLLGIGTIGFLLTHGGQQADFATRGQVTGEGIPHLARSGIPLAVAFGVSRAHWNSRRLCWVSVIAICVLVTAGTRAPLLLVGAAVAVRYIVRLSTARRRAFVLMTAMVIGYAGLIIAVALPQWRSDVANGRAASLPTSLAESARDPIAQVGNSGLDTFDGLVLSTKVDRRVVDARWTDPATAITTFVPRQIWPTKPEFLGPVVTHAYLNFGGRAGMFLSAPGYLFIVYGGAPGMIIAFFLLGLATGQAFSRLRPDSILAVLLTYFLFLFFIGGDAFPLFQSLGLVGLFMFSAAIARFWRELSTHSRKSSLEMHPSSGSGMRQRLEDSAI